MVTLSIHTATRVWLSTSVQRHRARLVGRVVPIWEATPLTLISLIGRTWAAAAKVMETTRHNASPKRGEPWSEVMDNLVLATSICEAGNQGPPDNLSQAAF